MSFKKAAAACRIVSHSPWLWFGSLQALLIAYYQWTQQLQPSLTLAHDTGLFLAAAQFPWMSAGMLNHYVLPGYPTVIQIARALSPDYRYLPWLHLGVQALAAGLWYRGLRRLEYPSLSAFAVSAPLLALPLMFSDFSPAAVASDATGLALALATIGWFLGLFHPSTRRRGWMILSFLFFASVLVRPVYLFLLGLLPFLSLALTRSHLPRATYRLRRWVFARTTALVMLVPLILFSGYRKMVIGDFSVSSGLGFNLIGITGQLLTPEMIPELPSDLRRFAASVIKHREERDWVGHPYRSPLTGPHGLYGSQLRENFNLLSWYAGFKAAAEEYPENIAGMNRLLTRFSFHVIRLRPRLYATWVVLCWMHGLRMLLSAPWVLGEISAGLILYLSLIVLRTFGSPRQEADAGSAVRLRLAGLSGLIALFFFATKFSEVALVEAMLMRYVLAAAALVPSVLVAYLLVVAPQQWDRKLNFRR